MANLLYICPNSDLQSSPGSLNIAKAMQSCSHQVRVLTTFSQANEDLEPPKNIEILMPFKNWSLVELPKLAYSLQGFTPDVVHFFFDAKDPNTGRLLNMSLPSLLKSLFGCKLALQLEGGLPKTSWTFSQWILQSDLVVTSDYFQLLKVSSLTESPSGQLHIPLHSASPAVSDCQELDWVKNAFDEFIFVAGTVPSVEAAVNIVKTCEYQLLENQSLGLVINIESLDGGVFAETELRAFLQDNLLEQKVILLRSLSVSQSAFLSKNCRSFFIAHLGIEPRNLSFALDSQLSETQTVSCTQQQAFFIRGSIRTPVQIQECQLGKPILQEVSPAYTLKNLQIKGEDEVSTDPMNSLNRAYSQIMNQ